MFVRWGWIEQRAYQTEVNGWGRRPSLRRARPAQAAGPPARVGTGGGRGRSWRRHLNRDGLADEALERPHVALGGPNLQIRVAGAQQLEYEAGALVPNLEP